MGETLNNILRGPKARPKGGALDQVERELAEEAARQQAAAQLPPDVLAQTAPVQTEGGSPFAVAGEPAEERGFSIHIKPELRAMTVVSDGLEVRSSVSLVGGTVRAEFRF